VAWWLTSLGTGTNDVQGGISGAISEIGDKLNGYFAGVHTFSTVDPKFVFCFCLLRFGARTNKPA
jgi:hypothetical protein